jgi:acyl-CoA thioester hydrolase
MTGKRPFEWPVRVYFEDTDAGGIVYYANYLKFMERARTEWLRTLGFEQDRLREEAGILLAVSRVAVNYVRPARFNERLLASVRLLKLRRASMSLAQEVSRESGEVVCTGLVRIASLDAASLRPRAMPAAMVKEIDVAD